MAKTLQEIRNQMKRLVEDTTGSTTLSSERREELDRIALSLPKDLAIKNECFRGRFVGDKDDYDMCR